MSRPRAGSRTVRCQRLSLCIGPSKNYGRAGTGIMPSPRGRAAVDFGLGLFGGLSGPRVSFTPGRVGALAIRSSVPLPLVG